MKTQLTTRCLFIRIILCVLVLGCRVWAGQFFFDDFSDGDPADGSPVNWVGVYDQTHSGYTLTPEGLKLGTAIAADRDGTPYIYRDVSVRVQIKRTSNHTDGNWASGLCCRWNDGGPGGYWIEVRPPNRFWLGHRDRWRLKASLLPFNVDEKELIIRVDMIGDQITCWCWPADEPMPDKPQITLVEDVVPDGTLELYAGTQGGQAIYRWVEAAMLEVLIVDFNGDFNGDGIVDFKDFCILAQYWHQDQSPFVNRRVDYKYLAVLADYWLKEVLPDSLIAYWKLDETEGILAHDSAGDHDGLLITENALWRPLGGMVNGTLELDGIYDYVSTPFVLDPDDGPFSVFAWVRGGAAGQVILSQAGRTNWLLTDSATGALMTELKPGLLGKPLSSQVVITDGDWCRVGLTWDGSNRILYVNDVEVAKDTQAGVASSDSGLNIGAGKNLSAGSFWSGLIDDVRIYNKALSPEEIEELER